MSSADGQGKLDGRRKGDGHVAVVGGATRGSLSLEEEDEDDSRWRLGAGGDEESFRGGLSDGLDGVGRRKGRRIFRRLASIADGR